MSPAWCRTYLGLLDLSLSRNRSPGCLTNEKPLGPPTQTWDKHDLPRNVRHHAGHMHLASPCLCPSRMLVRKFNIFLPWNLVKGDFMCFAYGLKKWWLLNSIQFLLYVFLSFLKGSNLLLNKFLLMGLKSNFKKMGVLFGGAQSCFRQYWRRAFALTFQSLPCRQASQT